MTSYNYMLLGEVILAASYRVSQGAEPAGDRSSGVFEKVTELASIKDIR